MNELVEQFLEKSEVMSNIQPYVDFPLFANVFFTVSILLLVLIILQLRFTGILFFEAFFRFVFSESYSLSFYKVKVKYGLLDVLLALFFTLQLSYLVFTYLPKQIHFFESLWLNFLLLFAVTFFLYLVKLFLYSSLKHLLPSRVDVYYYGFNYAYWCFYFGIFLFLVNLIGYVKFGTIPLLFLLVSALVFYCFLIIRVISISLRYNIMRSVYIFLYFCTLEIAPFVILLNNNGVF